MKNRLAIAMLSILPLSLSSCGTMMDVYADADKYLVGNQTYNSALTTLDIDWISGNLTLVEDASLEGVKIEEDTTLTNDDELVHSYLNEGILKIKYFASGHVCHTFNYKKDLKVSYKPGLDLIHINLTSGHVNSDVISSRRLELDMTSGTAKIKSLTSDEVDVDLTSGSVEVTTMNSKSLRSDMTSGSWSVGFAYIETAKFDLTSGDVNMTLPNDGGKVKVSKTSGRVVTNRQCSISGDTYTFDSGLADIQVSMTSGSVTIN